jgi:hypothetical protein
MDGLRTLPVYDLGRNLKERKNRNLNQYFEEQI